MLLDGCGSWQLSCRSFYVRLLYIHFNFLYRHVLQQDLVVGIVKK